MGLETIALVALGVAGASTASSIYQSRKTRKQQKKANAVASRRRAIESRRATIGNIEDARQAIGTVQNTAALTGAQGGSGAQGAQGSLVSQMGANITFNQQLLQFAERQEQYLQKAMDAQNRAQSFSQIAQLSLSVASMSSKPAAKNTGNLK